MATLDKYNIVFNILQDKLNQLSEDNNEISCGIDQIEGIWYSNANTVNSITNQIHLNGDKFILLISKTSIVCHTIKYGTGFKITLTPENIIFTFTSNFLRKIGSSSVTIKCVQYFFSSTGIDYTTDYIEKKLQTNYVESYTDILSTPTVLKDLNKLCKLIHTDLLGDVPPQIPRIRIDQLINHRSAQEEIQARAGVNLKVLQPFYSENENGEIKKNARCRAKIYNKLFQMVKCYKHNRHWWKWHKEFFNFNDHEFQIFDEIMQDLTLSYLKKIYTKFISKAFSIVRLEYCLTGSYIKQIVKKSGDVRYEQFSYFINCLNNFTDLFFLSSATWEPKIIQDDAKYHLLSILTETKNKIINGEYKSLPPIKEDNENLMEKVRMQKERQLNGYHTGISNIYYNSADFTKTADERIKLIQGSLANLSRLMEIGQKIIKELGDK